MPYVPPPDYLSPRFGLPLISQSRIQNEFLYRITQPNFPNGSVLENWSSPSGWTGGSVSTLPDGSAARQISLTSDGAQWKIYKDMTSLLPWKWSFAVWVWVDNPANINWAGMFFGKENWSGSVADYYGGYFQNQLKAGLNLVILRQDQFTAYGTPGGWASTPYFKIGATAKSGYTAVIKVGKVMMYQYPGMVTLQADDGYGTVLTRAYPYMAAKSPVIRGNCAIARQYLGRNGSMVEENLRTLMAAGWKMHNHTYTHQHLTSMTDPAEIEMEIAKGAEYCHAISNGAKSGLHFTPSYFQSNATVDRFIKKYAVSAGAGAFTNGNPYYLYLPFLDPMHLKLSVLLQATTAATVNGWIDTAIAQGAWIILVFHNVWDTTQGDFYDSGYADNNYPYAQFTQIIDHISTAMNAGTLLNVSYAEALAA